MSKGWICKNRRIHPNYRFCYFTVKINHSYHYIMQELSSQLKNHARNQRKLIFFTRTKQMKLEDLFFRSTQKRKHVRPHKQKPNGESYFFIGLHIHKCYGSSQVCKSFVSYLWLEIIDLNFGITPCENLIQSAIHHWWDRNSQLCLNLNIFLQTFENTITQSNYWI